MVTGAIELRDSQNTYDWLGHGMYFWEGNPARALNWAKKTKVKKPAVLGAIIKLGRCLNLLDNTHIELVKQSYGALKSEMHVLELEMPENRAADGDDEFLKRRELDCRVVEYLHDINETRIRAELKKSGNLSAAQLTTLVKKHPDRYDSVRGMFPEGNILYPTAGFRMENHIQICLRNPNCALGYFLPRKQDKKYASIL